MKVLVAGWLAGGAFIVLISVLLAETVAKPVEPSGATTAGSSSAASGSVSPGAAVSIIVPVLGIAASQLRDNFDQVRGGGRIHHAIDIMAPHGTPVVAAVDGTIQKLFNSKAGGITIYQFDQAEARVYYYAHLARYAAGMAEGLFVKQGTVIGYVGVTGNAAPDAPHLHFSIEVLPPTKEWWKGIPLNPFPLLTRRASVLP
ncbi:MAG TPA: M23 family metallopeptidase [Thermoanaerobaculia bacterium]|jgi:murein DD-endopeptidase MepM/ murein hydrolase activator NlpD